MSGWIKVHRVIQSHWIWEDDKYLKWWMTILLTVNHKTKMFPVGTELIECKPGQSFRSIDKWREDFGCSKPTVIKFFSMLKKDNMIDTEIIGKGNRRKHLLTVLNWCNYQQDETENFTETKPKTLPKENPNVPPNKNDNNDKKERKTINERKQDFAHLLNPFLEKYDNVMLNEFFAYWTEHGINDRKMRFEKEKSFGIGRRLATWNKNQSKYGKNKSNNTGREKGAETARTVENIIAEIEQTQR